MANIVYLSIISVLTLLHPIHISVTEIEHDDEARSLEMVMRIFIDDLELDIRNELGEPRLDITKPGRSYTTDGLLEDYLRKHFKLQVNGKKKEYNYLGHEIELPVMYLYIEAPKVNKVRDIEIFNDMIMNAYDDQTNIIHVEVSGKLRSMRLDSDRKKDRLEF